MNNILITGANGTIGRALRTQLAGAYGLLRLADITPQPGVAGPGEEFVTLDICDSAALNEAMRGMDCVVHLAGVPQESNWEQVLALNIDGCYQVFESARLQGVKRFIFASSNHAIGFHRREEVLESSAPARPDTRYGVSKVFGEALGRLYADKHGMSVACLRIGTFRTPDRPTELRHLLTWVSHRDMAQLVRKCIDYPDYHFLVAYGVSANTRNAWSNSEVAFLGYAPQDNAEAFAPEILAAAAPESDVSGQFHGGPFCELEFTGKTERII